MKDMITYVNGPGGVVNYHVHKQAFVFITFIYKICVTLGLGVLKLFACYGFWFGLSSSNQFQVQILDFDFNILEGGMANNYDHCV